MWLRKPKRGPGNLKSPESPGNFRSYGKPQYTKSTLSEHSSLHVKGIIAVVERPSKVQVQGIIALYFLWSVLNLQDSKVT